MVFSANAGIQGRQGMDTGFRRMTALGSIRRPVGLHIYFEGEHIDHQSKKLGNY